MNWILCPVLKLCLHRPVNFVFLIEGDHQTRGLHVEIEDEPWAALCEATRDQVDPLPKVTIDEAHQWVCFFSSGQSRFIQSTFKSLATQ